MATTTLWTYQDVIDHLSDWQGGIADAKLLRNIKRAILTAYRDITNARLWSYYNQRGRVTTVADYDTGTIAYTHSTRAVTLTTGTWPSWAARGVLLIDDVEYQVYSRDSSSQITLSVNSNPGENVASGTSYSIYQDTYTLPVDFTEAGEFKDIENSRVLDMVTPDEWLGLHNNGTTPSQPYAATIVQDPDYQGVMALRIFPPSDAVYRYDYMYRRMPRQLLTPQYNTGTVTTSTTTVTGTSTSFTSNMLGSVIRFSSSTSTAPTGIPGANPFTAERIITAFGSTTSLTIDSALSAELTGVKYEISDPIDLEQGAMYSFFLRKCEYELGCLLNKSSDLPALTQKMAMAERLAREADSRTRQPTGSGWYSRLPNRFDLTDMQPT